jgi:hypothetical protein
MKRMKFLIGMAGISLAMAFALTSCDDVLAEIRKGLGADTAGPQSFAELVAQMKADAGKPSGTYTLPGYGKGETYTDDLKLTPGVTCPATVTIDGGEEGGYIVTGKGSIDGIVVGSGVTLTLTSITFKNLKFTVDGMLELDTGAVLRDNSGSGVTVRPGGFLEMKDGSLVTANGYSGVLLWAAGESESPPEFLMSGGTVSGNLQSGVRLDGQGSEFTMRDGTITGNSCAMGGGVRLNGTGSKFDMQGGLISGNTAGDGGGGGVAQCGVNTEFNMQGGEISGNAAHQGGGLEIIGAGSKFTMQTGTISGNTAAVYGGGLDSWENVDVTILMLGGLVTGNTAQYGGGILVTYGCKFDMSGGDITGNKAASGGGVYLSPGQIINGNYSVGTKVDGKGSIYGNTKLDGSTTDDVYYEGGEAANEE